MPTIHQSFTVPLPPSEVWALFDDIPTVAQCMPGAELTGQEGPDRYSGQLKVKLGPMGASFEGIAEVTQRNDEAMEGQVTAKGVDKRGGSRASASIDYRVIAQGASSSVEIDADISLQGALAQFGRSGIIHDVSARLTDEFASCLKGKLLASTPQEAAAVSASQVNASTLVLDAVRSLMRRALEWLNSSGRRGATKLKEQVQARRRR